MSPSKVYDFLLDKLPLTPQHLESLLARGIPEAEITARGYKSWPYKRRALVASCVAEFGDSLLGVPGFWKDETGKIQLSGVSGIAIPIRTPKGVVEGIKLRPDNPANPTSKYVHLSSNPAPNKKTGEVKYPNGTAAKVQVHFPFAKEKFKEGQDLRITEGELKADIATLLSPTYTASIPGVGLWREALPYIEELKPGRVILSYDADKSNQVSTYSDQPFEVALHLSEFYTCLTQMGVKAVIEDWPVENGKGIDDLLADGHIDKIRYLTEAESEKFCKKTIGQSSGDEAEWVYIIASKRFVNTTTGQELDKDQYRDKFQFTNKKKDVVAKALNSPAFPRIDYPTYEPAKGKVLKREDGLSEYNFWRPSGVMPEEGNVDIFIEHCQYILPDETECKVLLDYLAWIIQRPGEKVHWALLLQGVQGTGKSYFGNLMQMILGEKNVNFPSNEDLHDKYTGWQKNCQLVVIEELMARGRLELMNKLKTMITQPMCTIREMYRESYELPNRFNFLILTNHEDAIIIDKHDRRYCVLWSPAEPKPASYYKALWNWTKQNIGKVLQFLAERDISSFEAKAHAPMTQAKVELIKISQAPLKVWISECIESESWPFMGDIVHTNHLVECIPPYLRGVTPNLLARTMKDCGCKQLDQVKLENGSRVRPWSVRRHEVWDGVGAKAVVSEIERWLADREPGGNPLMDAKPI